MENVEQKAKDWIEDAAQQKIIKSIPQSEFKSDSFEELIEVSIGVP